MANALASYTLALSKNPNHCGVYEYLGAYPTSTHIVTA
jgi:hypothetical protein